MKVLSGLLVLLCVGVVVKGQECSRAVEVMLDSALDLICPTLLTERKRAPLPIKRAPLPIKRYELEEFDEFKRAPLPIKKRSPLPIKRAPLPIKRAPLPIKRAPLPIRRRRSPLPIKRAPLPIKRAPLPIKRSHGEVMEGDVVSVWEVREWCCSVNCSPFQLYFVLNSYDFLMC